MPRQLPLVPGQFAASGAPLDGLPITVEGTPNNAIHVLFPPAPGVWRLSEVTLLGEQVLQEIDVQDARGCELIVIGTEVWSIVEQSGAFLTITDCGCHGGDAWKFSWSRIEDGAITAAAVAQGTRNHREAQEREVSQLGEAFLQISDLPRSVSTLKQRIKELSAQAGESLSSQFRSNILQRTSWLKGGAKAEGGSPVPSAVSSEEGPVALPPVAEPEKIVAFLGAAAFPSLNNPSPFVRYVQSGLNFGNLVIGDGAELITTAVGSQQRQKALYQMGGVRPDLTIIRAANFLNSSVDLTTMSDQIERSQSRIAIMGLGCQSNLESDQPSEWAKHPVPLKEGTLRFVRYIAKHCTSIGVRGEFTALQLRLLGIENTRVLGCPSFFARPKATLGALRAMAEVKDSPRTLFNSTPSILKSPTNRAGLMQFHRLCVDAGGDMIVQTELELLKARSVLRPSAGSLGIVCSMFGLEDATVARQFAAQRCFAFTNVAAWRQFAQGYDLSVGPRFHGNILALQSGVPALFLTHDSRTRELTQTLSLPSVQISEIGPDFSPSQALRKSQQDGAAAERYPVLLRRFLRFLAENEIPVNGNWLTEACEVAGVPTPGGMATRPA